MLIAPFEDEENVLAILTANTFISVTSVVFGLITLSIASFGICGAIAKSRTMVKIYTFVLSLMIVLQTGMIVFAKIDENYLMIFEQIWESAEESAIIKIQTELECCGLRGAKEYDDDKDGKGPHNSCVEDGYFGTGFTSYETGCRDKIKEWAKANKFFLMVAGSAVILVNIVMLIVSVCTWCCQPKEKKFRKNQIDEDDQDGCPGGVDQPYGEDDTATTHVGAGFVEDEFDEMDRQVRERSRR